MEDKLLRLRVMDRLHSLLYCNHNNTIRLAVQYKGQKPLRSILYNDVDNSRNSILLDYIQLVIKDKKLELKSIED